jgi:hypothetical protein
MRSSGIQFAVVAAVGLVVLGTATLPAQTLSRKIDLGKDSPVTLLSADWGDSNATARGGAYLVDVHAALSLRNSGQRRIRSVTLAVYAQEVTPGGKGSVSVPSLDVAPGDTFSVRIDMPLLRPLGAAAGGPGVEVRLDGVLFDDLSFYGPDQLHSQRTMTLWEMEARRDRKYFKQLLETAGTGGLQKEMLNSLARQADRQQPGVQMVRGRSTNTELEKEVQFAFLEVPEAPVEASAGTARMTANEARAPRFEVRNRSTRAVKFLEIGWIVKDQQGREFLAASMPADLSLAPSQQGPVVQDAALRFSQSIAIQSMAGFVSGVEFADGTYWIPSRSALDVPRLRDLVAPSPEEQRLTQLYRKKGLSALVDELKKF